ncbi:50S ribosomal protein L25/general stress protein Ctc [bacterium 3DAC]|jgi:large subunit ribosomal protein L25|nr:50S ribosomal protein L25/general stress protein Ctc [Dictyoglomota bacterium]UZN23212.1 50S ribosomal protein L25/general stress protein Ctc [bacterium 3DAC]
MIKQIELKAELRQEQGTRPVRRLRQAGYMPGVVYGKDIDPIPIKVNMKDFRKTVKEAHGGVVFFKVSIDGKEPFLAVLQDIQRDNVTREVIHFDLHKIAEDEEITVDIPIEFVGEPKGVKEGGILEIVLHELEIEAPANKIPEKIVVDLSDLGIDDTIHVEDLQLPEGVRTTHDPEEVVVTVTAPEEEAALEEEVEEMEEPELIGGRGKTEEEE